MSQSATPQPDRTRGTGAATRLASGALPHSRPVGSLRSALPSGRLAWGLVASACMAAGGFALLAGSHAVARAGAAGMSLLAGALGLLLGVRRVGVAAQPGPGHGPGAQLYDPLT